MLRTTHKAGMKTNLRIPGVRAENTYSSELIHPGRKSVVKVTQKAAVQIDLVRGAGDQGVDLALADDDVLELELEGGLRLWTSFRQFQLDFPGVKRPARDGAPLEPEPFPVDLAAGGASRGLGTMLLRAVRVLEVGARDGNLPQLTAAAIAAAIDNHLPERPALFRCSTAQPLAARVASPPPLLSDRPVLIFIHGTASSTVGSFGGLWEPAQSQMKDELFKFYGDQVYAFEHRTLTESPVQNALQLLALLPKNARLHLVSHSRGGLVGELLCLGQRTSARDFDPLAPDNLQLFFPDSAATGDAGPAGAEKFDRSQDRDDLTTLAQQLKEKQPTVERFVRVACPARGTTLASGRLDHWLSTVVNVLALAGLKANPAYAMALDLVLAVAKERTDPRALPGLEAQMPESPLVWLLNHPAFTVTADLTVISGGAEGEGIWGRMKLLLPNLFYGEDHDLIVNTSAMYGGAMRSAAPWYFFDQGAEVNHFQYFKNPNTARRLLAGLTRPKGFESEFSALPDTLRQAPREAVRGGTQPSRGSAGPRPVVFVLPGFMGSHLTKENQLTKNRERIWLEPLEVALGRLSELDIDNQGIEPDGMLGNYYGDLVQFLLGSGHEVVAFPFDWRKSLRDEAHRLAEAITAKLEQTEAAGLPVRVFAHGMGGLVARMLIAERPAVWRRFTARTGARLLLLGTPTAGSFVIPRLLLGREQSLRMLAMLDRKHGVAELVALLGRFPGLLEMLPRPSGANDANATDFFALEFWQQALNAGGPGAVALPVQAGDLAKARAAQEQLQRLDATPATRQPIVYVAGQAAQTPCGVKLNPEATGAARVEFLGTTRGDGVAAWDTSVPSGVAAFLVVAAHGDLPAHADSFPAYLDLLETGTTQRLPELPAATNRGDTPEVLPSLLDQPVGAFPTMDELVASAVGAAPPSRRPKSRPPIAVTVVHGDLAFTRNAVLVGHYQGDAIVSAEEYLDGKLDRRLRERERLGLYPGELETTGVFLKPGGFPGGAVVIGLGQVGKLAAGNLSRAILHGVLRLALAVLETPATATELRPDGKRSLKLSSLLIGTGEGGLAVEAAIRAILEGVSLARAALERARLDHKLVLAGVEFIELQEDQAILAARALGRLRSEPRLASVFRFAAEVTVWPGGRRRAAVTEPPGWWDRLEITAKKDGTLRFVTLTRRARAEVVMVPTQRALVDQFITRAITNPGRDADTAHTLFQLLLPNELKDLATSRRDLLLLLDDAAARFPWELLESRPEHAANRAAQNARPPAVEAGLIRQLATAQFRRGVLHATADAALVVGNPESEFADLPGAEHEARAVEAALFRHHYTVTAHLHTHSLPIITALFAGPYRILHLAGHGVYEHPLLPPPDAANPACPCPEFGAAPPQKVTGMVLGHGVFLTPAEVAQMPQVPELVFINCCHLGRIEDPKPTPPTQQNQLAANLATEFIRIGVRAVIAAGWAVDDAAASTFAVTFYEQMLGGATFGKAVQTARQVTYDNHKDVNTWGAYQCYGDHAFRLRPNGGSDGDAASSEPFTHFREVVMAAENIAGDAVRATTDAELARLRQQLERLIKDTPEKWADHGEVCAACGKAWAELGEFPNAIAQYQRAIVAEKCAVPLAAAEQLANLEVRHAVGLFHDPDPAKRATASGLLDTAAARLEHLLALGPTTERLNLRGSLEKRRAEISTAKKEVATALAAMEQYYGQARDQTPAATRAKNFYSSSNWLLARVLRAKLFPPKSPAKLPGTKLLSEIESWRDALETQAASPTADAPDFWTVASLADALLLHHLAADALAANQSAVSDRYRTARDCGATMKQTKSVLEHLDFIAAVLDPRSAGQRFTATVDALRAIHAAVTT